MSTTTTTRHIAIGSLWSTFKTPADVIVLVISHSKGWYEARPINNDGEFTGDSIKLRASTFDMEYERQEGMFNVVQPMSIFEGPEAHEAQMADARSEAEVVVEVPAATICHNAMAQHISHYAGSYLKVKTTTGYSRICGDDLSELLRHYEVAVILTVASGVCGQDLATKYAHLNKGQQRMCSGNLLRRAVKDQVLDIATIAKALADWSVA